jgi:hypothetical protein
MDKHGQTVQIRNIRTVLCGIRNKNNFNNFRIKINIGLMNNCQKLSDKLEEFNANLEREKDTFIMTPENTWKDWLILEKAKKQQFRQTLICDGEKMFPKIFKENFDICIKEGKWSKFRIEQLTLRDERSKYAKEEEYDWLGEDPPYARLPDDIYSVLVNNALNNYE